VEITKLVTLLFISMAYFNGVLAAVELRYSPQNLVSSYIVEQITNSMKPSP